MPSFTTARLVLRPFAPDDAESVCRIVSDPAVAGMIDSSPGPCDLARAAHWIDEKQANFDHANALSLAVTLPGADTLIGCVNLTHNPHDAHAEIDYWIAREQWNHGYATEAAARMIRFAFAQWRVHRIFACHFARNIASGRVLEKLGFTREGTLRDHYRSAAGFEPLVYWGLLQNEWIARCGAPDPPASSPI